MKNKRSYLVIEDKSQWFEYLKKTASINIRNLTYVHPISSKPTKILDKAHLLALNGRCIGDLTLEEQHCLAFMVFSGRQFNIEVQLKYMANDLGVGFDSLNELNYISKENKVVVLIRQFNSVVCQNCGEKVAI